MLDGLTFALLGLGLAAVVEQSGGTLVSDGLAFFTGQELVLDASLAVDRVTGTQLLLRIIDWLVEELWSASSDQNYAGTPSRVARQADKSAFARSV